MASRTARNKPSRKGTPEAKATTVGGIAFEIQLEERPRSAGPGRLRHREQREQITLADVQEKQRQADERRKAAEAEKLQKIHIRDETVKKIPQKKEVTRETGPHRNDMGSQETPKPFDEDEVVPALKNKIEGQKTGAKTSKCQSGKKKPPNSKLPTGKSTKRS